MRENWGMLGFRTYKQLPAGLMQVEQEITSAGQESHSKVCHPMAESSPAIQLRPSEKDASSKQALALYSTLGYCCCCPPPPTPVARKPGWFILSPGQREKDWMVMAAEHYYCCLHRWLLFSFGMSGKGHVTPLQTFMPCNYINMFSCLTGLWIFGYMSMLWYITMHLYSTVIEFVQKSFSVSLYATHKWPKRQIITMSLEHFYFP